MGYLRLDRDDYTVGWICALPVELKAARAMLDEQHESPMQRSGDNNSYTAGRIGAHNVVIAVLPAGRIGTNPASTIGSDMGASFKSLRFGLMVGIGGGVPSEKNDIRLGDVVVSVPAGRFPGVVQYDMGKALANDVFEPTGFLNSPPPIVLTTVNKLRSLEGEKLLKYLSVFDVTSPSSENPYPGLQQDRLYKAEYSHRYPSDETCESCDPCNLVPRPIHDGKPCYHYGTIASGNLVIKDGMKRDQLEKEHGILCFEMEAAGLMNTFPCLVIRGICDYSDSHKNSRWQPYAAATAAAYAKVLLEHIPPNPQPRESDALAEKGLLTSQILPGLALIEAWPPKLTCYCSISVDIKGKDRYRKESEASILSDIIPLKTPKFFGRRSELEKMHKYLEEDSDGRKIVVLCGLGGFGKTQLALQYWTEVAEEYSSKIWVDATSLETVLESFKDISTKLGHQLPHAVAMHSPSSVLSSPKVIFADIKRWLSSLSNCRWLMVIDNVEDLDGEFHIRELVPDCTNGSIIVISTQSETADILEAKSIEIAKIDDEAGAGILLHRFKKITQSEEGEHFSSAADHSSATKQV
jgi:nucleoside phosphorylase